MVIENQPLKTALEVLELFELKRCTDFLNLVGWKLEDDSKVCGVLIDEIYFQIINSSAMPTKALFLTELMFSTSRPVFEALENVFATGTVDPAFYDFFDRTKCVKFPKFLHLYRSDILIVRESQIALGSKYRGNFFGKFGSLIGVQSCDFPKERDILRVKNSNNNTWLLCPLKETEIKREYSEGAMASWKPFNIIIREAMQKILEPVFMIAKSNMQDFLFRKCRLQEEISVFQSFYFQSPPDLLFFNRGFAFDLTRGPLRNSIAVENGGNFCMIDNGKNMRLDYKSDWPANKVLDGSVQKDYNEIMNFLIDIKKAQANIYQLRKDRKCILQRLRLQAFVNNLQMYAFHVVIVPLVNSTKFERFCSLEQIITVHKAFLAKIRSGLFLDVNL